MNQCITVVPSFSSVLFGFFTVIMASCALTAFASVFAPQSCHDACSGFHEVFDFCAANFVRDFALKRVACVHNSFNLLTTTSGVFGENIAAVSYESKS